MRLQVNDWKSIGWARSRTGNFISVEINEYHDIIWSIDDQKISFKNNAIKRDSLVSISQCENNLILIEKWKKINVWYLEDREQNRKEIRKIKEFFSDYEIRMLMWSPDGKYIIAADENRSLMVWNYSSGIVKKIDANEWIEFIDVSTRGNFIIGGGRIHEVVKIWKF